MVVLLGSDAQQSQNADDLIKIHFQIPARKRSSMSMWPHCAKKSAESMYTTFDISLPCPYWSDRCAYETGCVSASGSFCLGFVDLP